ncbi:hypothetical protein BG004_005544, partial [Podila humilis]
CSQETGQEVGICQNSVESLYIVLRLFWIEDNDEISIRVINGFSVGPGINATQGCTSESEPTDSQYYSTAYGLYWAY